MLFRPGGLNRNLFKEFFILVLAAACLPVLADETHTNDTLPGSKASMMGGAFHSLADDPSAAYYNPSGLAFIDKSEVSVNATAFYSKNIRYKKALNYQDFKVDADSTFPSLIASVYRFGPLKVGYSVITLDNRNIKQNDYFENISDRKDFAKNFSRFHHESVNWSLYGTSCAFKIGKLGFGASAYYYIYDREQTIHQLVDFDGGRYLNLDQSVTSKGNGFIGIAGLIFRSDNISAALVAKDGKKLTFSSVMTEDAVIHEPLQTAAVSHSNSQVSSQELLLPKAYTFSISYHPKSTGLSAAYSGIYHPSMTYPNLPSSRFRAVINHHLGAEAALSSMLGMRAGFFTNWDLNPNLDPNLMDQPSQINYLGASFGLVFQSKDFISGLSYVAQKGEGKAQIVSGILEMQDVQAQSQMVIVSLSYVAK